MARCSLIMRVFPCVVAVVITLSGVVFSGCGGSREAKTRSGASGGEIALPAPRTEGGMRLDEALEERRSQRSFSQRGLTLEQVSQLLWAAQGVTEPSKGFRTAPSAGALYPLELYMLEEGVLYHYLPGSHSIEPVSRGVDKARLADAAAGQQSVAEAPVVFVIAAVFERTRAKYGERADRYVQMEAGHAAQNLLLEAVSLGLGAVPVGAYHEKTTSDVLSLPTGVSPLYLIPVGYPVGQRQ